jgi:C4-dicarboxylate-specific signal transduction histidine kinase
MIAAMSAQPVRYYDKWQEAEEKLRRSEEALNELRAALAHSGRIASLGTLTASIAHEVNQPLSGIVTNASTCLRMLSSDPPNIDGARETARRTIRDGNRASDVITRLRSLFCKGPRTTDLLDLNDAVRDVIPLLQLELQRFGVELTLDLAGDFPLVIADRVQVQQVIINFVRNAAEAESGLNGRREIIARTWIDAHDGLVCACVSVRDAGVGLPSTGTEKLFDAFHSTKLDGMGIGLAVCRWIIEGHGGRIWAAPNDDGPGATFSFSIPHIPGGSTYDQCRGSADRIRG